MVKVPVRKRQRVDPMTSSKDWLERPRRGGREAGQEGWSRSSIVGVRDECGVPKGSDLHTVDLIFIL